MIRSLLVSMVLAGCSFADPDPQLERFASCEELGEYMRDMALREARWDYAVDFDVSGFASGQEMGLADAAPKSAESFSETNLQELGVDEADLMKTDGTWLYSVAGEHLVITKVFPLEEAAVASTVHLDGQVDGLYLDGDQVVALSTVWDRPTPRSGYVNDRNEVRTLVTVIDVADRAAPTVLRETYTSGELRTSRKIGDRLYVVTYVDVVPSAPYGASSWREAKQDIDVTPPEAWLPRRTDNLLRGDGGWDSADESSCACTEVYASDAEGGTYATSVLSLDLADPTSDFAGEAVIGRADTVYASPGSLYVAYTETEQGAFATLDGELDTILHRFDIGEDVAQPRYRTTAKVDGVVPDQFALSEQDGVLRLATTDTTDWTTNVLTLDAAGGDLDELDRIRGIAPGENLFAARFVGDMGYLVTYVVDEDGWSFPDVPLGDPLFTIDLSDPEDLQTLGELKIDGWSDYIHPLDEGHLLTVGMDDGPEGWQVAVSLFDVTDPRQPRLAEKVFPGSVDSEATVDHHAFNWYPEYGLLAIPGHDGDWETGLDLVRADPRDLEVVGTVSQAPEVEAMTEPSCAPIRRSVFLDDQVWAISGAGLTAAYADAPGTPARAVPFPLEVQTCAGWTGGYGYYGY